MREVRFPTMYRVDWIEQLKLRSARVPTAERIAAVNPMVVKLGCTSLLTDISAEMVNSVLPLYLVLYLHANPLQFGAVDGLYNGAAVVLFGLAGGMLADRTRRPKEVAGAGYGLSAVCKLLLLVAGGALGWIAAIIAADRVGKGLRTAPRDALISLHGRGESLATAFAVHRAMDAGGSLLGPIVAFAILSSIPGAFDAVWIVSFAFAIVGFAVLWLFVRNPAEPALQNASQFSLRAALALVRDRRVAPLLGAGMVLSLVTVSDAFLYLLLQQRSQLAIGFFPLFYVITAGSYMLLSIPMGTLADRWGRRRVFLSGYAVIGLLYVFLIVTPTVSLTGTLTCLLLFGLHYAATEGVLAAMAGARIPAELRSSGLAALGTLIATGRLCSSVLFGWLWYVVGADVAILVFAAALALALPVAAIVLQRGTAGDVA